MGGNMITTIIILVLLIIVLSYTSYNLFKKLEKLENIADLQEQYIDNFSKTIGFTNKRLQDIDDKGTFASDDDIGWFFESIKTLQRELDDYNINNTRENIQQTTGSDSGR
jgi:hypothetical protein